MVAQIEYLEVGTAIVIALAILTLIIIAALYVVVALGKHKDIIVALKTVVGHQEKTLDQLKDSCNDDSTKLWEQIDQMKKIRTDDVLRFTEVIGKLDKTLSKTDQTLEHLNTTIQEFKTSVNSNIDELREDFEKLRDGSKKG